jgi:signal transduction histidine kinase/tetratricopeptide (TPR) repeat protein
MIKNLIVGILIICSNFLIAQVNPVIDSLQNVVNGNKHDTLKTYAYSDLCWEYRLLDQDKAIQNGLNGIVLSRKINFKLGEGKNLNDLSIIYIDLGRLDSAIVLLNEAKIIKADLNDQLGVAAIHNKLGIIYQNQYQLDKALTENLAALKIYEEENIPQYITHIKNNIANIHFRLGDYDKAIEIHKETLEIRKNTGDLIGVAQSYVNLGNVYDEKGDTDLAIKNYKKAVKIFENEEAEKSLSFALNNLGSLQLDTEDYKNSEINLLRALKLREGFGDNKTICSTHILLGKLYINRPNHDYKKAEKSLKYALELNKEIGLDINKKDIYHELSSLYRAKKSVDSAFHYHDLYNQILEEEYQVNLNSKVSELQTVYETEKKDKENETLARINAEEEAKRKATELKLANRNNWIIGISLGLMAIILLSLLIIQINKQKAKEELQNKLDLERKKGIKAVFESQEKERSRISKDLHDSIGAQLSGLKMAWSKISTKLNKSDASDFNELIGLTEVLDQTATEVRDLSHQMMPKTLKELGIVVALKDMLEKTFKFSDIQFEFDNFGLEEERFSENIEIGLYRISQELANNIIKHSKATKAEFQIFKRGNKLQLIVSDNGVGFIDKIITKGHGLSNINTRLSTINGKCINESDNGAITRILIDL